MGKAIDLPYENGYLLKDRIGLPYPPKGRIFVKGIKTTQGKLLKIFFEILDNFELIDIWRHKDGD